MIYLTKYYTSILGGTVFLRRPLGVGGRRQTIEEGREEERKEGRNNN